MEMVESRSLARVPILNSDFSPKVVNKISSLEDSELIQLGNENFSVPVELYDLKNLSFVLSVSNWNELLSEGERFILSKYLPDMDEETLTKTLIELFSGANFHFGCPVVKFFGKLKGGEFEQGVSVYLQGINSFRRRKHYFQVWKYHDSMVDEFFWIKDAWDKCKGYGVQERLQVLNIMRSRRNLGDENDGDSSDENDGDSSNGNRELNDSCKTTGEIKGQFLKRYNELGGDVYADSCKTTGDIKWQFLKRYNKLGGDVYAESPDFVDSRKLSNEVTIASYARDPRGHAKKRKYFDKNWMNSTNVQSHYQTQKGAQVDWLDENMKTQYPVRSDGTNVSSRKLKNRDELGTYKRNLASDSAVKPYKTYNGSSLLYSDRMSKISNHEEFKTKFNQTESGDMESRVTFDQIEDIESDSLDEDENVTVIGTGIKQLNYPNGAMGSHRLSTVRSVYDPVNINKLSINGEKPYILALESETGVRAREEAHLNRGKQMAKLNASAYLHNPRLSKASEQLQLPYQKAFSVEKWQKGSVCPVQSPLKTTSGHAYRDSQIDEYQDAMYVRSNLHNDQPRAISLRSQAQSDDSPIHETGHDEESYMLLFGCKAATKKQMGKVEDAYRDEPYESIYHQLNVNSKMDYHGRKKNSKTGAATRLSNDVTQDLDISGKETLDDYLEARSQKKSFTLITPTVHTSFSFSIIHLLSAIRNAMIVSDVDGVNDGGNNVRKDDRRVCVQNSFPYLTVQEISNRVRTNPGDPCILEMQEPLEDLIRGALKIFSSKTSFGSKGWKALVSYEKSNKGWSWVGPVSSSLSSNNTLEEETSPQAWGLPYKMLVNLVNAFANWLKSSQEILKQIGSLPSPPITMLVNLDEKERFKDLRTQKNPSTINSSSDEQRAYFRKEEFLRYLVPDRAFSYTAADGKKSSVAPLTRGAGKPTSKARDHYMLRPDRPPHVTVRCVVRDAAARLPGCIGTRADVCTLLRDSQFIVEDVTNVQVNQVVSGALDRLHSEVDPCIHFDSDRKLWVYLHRDREEEDFEDDGTSSTKNWKRPRKDATEHISVDHVNDSSYHGNEDPTYVGSSAGLDLNSEVNS